MGFKLAHMFPDELIFGVHFAPEGADFEKVRRLCLYAEELGFNIFTITDHFLSMTLGFGVAAPPHLIRHPLECWTTLAGLAALTNRIRLGPLVSCYYFRLPTVLAKMATTIDIISKGRLVFGLGAGWHKMEFESFIGKFPTMRERLLGLEETIQICRSMFTQEETSFRGRIYRFEKVVNLPLPIQRPPPLIVGGGGKGTLRIAARHADISHFPNIPDERILDQKLTILKEYCRSIGRDYNEIVKGILLGVATGYTKEEIKAKLWEVAALRGMSPEEFKKRMALVDGNPDQCIKAIKEKYIDRGITFFTLLLPTPRDYELFAKEVMPELRRAYR